MYVVMVGHVTPPPEAVDVPRAGEELFVKSVSRNFGEPSPPLAVISELINVYDLIWFHSYE